MSIEKIYSSPEMTKVELGKYVSDVKEEMDRLWTDFGHQRRNMVESYVWSLGAYSAAALVGVLLAVSSHSLTLTLSLSFGPTAPFLVGSMVGIVIFGQKGVEISKKIGKAETEKADRSVDLQNEANRLWVKKEQLLAMKELKPKPYYKKELLSLIRNYNKEIPIVRQETEERLQLIEEKFGIRSNVNSEEEYLAYWARS